jgi:hypothetical protein
MKILVINSFAALTLKYKVLYKLTPLELKNYEGKK